VRFSTWFVKQFGRIPVTDAALGKMERRAESLRAELKTVEEEIAYYRRSEIQFRAARIAWNVRDVDK
jgi:hypothetical protein